METGWGFVATRGLWRHVTSSEPYSLPRNAVRIETSTGRGNFTVFWALNYRDKIVERLGQFNSWIGHDLTLDLKEPLGLQNTRLTAGVYNVTDAKTLHEHRGSLLNRRPDCSGLGTYFLRNPQHALLRY